MLGFGASPRFLGNKKEITPTKSLLLRVFTTLFPASLAISNLLPDIDPEVSIIKMTFFAPEVAITYHGLNLGS